MNFLKNDSVKLLLSVVALFSLIVFSYQRNAIESNYQPTTIKFLSSHGMVSLDQFKGKIVLLYFGFLTCPEACPTTMSHVSKAFKELTPEELNKVVMIFIDLDPKRDSIEKLTEYTGYFHKNIIPFWAEEKTTRPLARYFGVEYREVPLKSTMGYTIDHSTDIVVVSPSGSIDSNIHHGTNSVLMLKNIRDLFKKFNL
jgi:protein SCO1/2